MSRFENLKTIGSVQDSNGNSYEMATQNGCVYLISLTKTYRNILYSKQFNIDYENGCEDMGNLDKYSFKIIHQEMK